MNYALFLILMGFCIFIASAKSFSESVKSDDSEEFNSDGGSDWSEFSDEDLLDRSDGEQEGVHEEESNPLTSEQEALLRKFQKRKDDKWEGATHGSVQASERLMKELRDTYRSSLFQSGQYDIELIDESLYEWNVFLRHFDKDSQISKDLKKLNASIGLDSVVLNIRFKDNFPYAPPFLRVVKPLLSGGFVASGGAICMELLTAQGWNPAYTVEAVVMQVSNVLQNGNTRIPSQNKGDAERSYNLKDAEVMFKQLEDIHIRNGWYALPEHD